MNPQEETQDTAQSAAYNPFPEPQTIPTGWDLSELTTPPQTDLKITRESTTQM